MVIFIFSFFIIYSYEASILTN